MKTSASVGTIVRGAVVCFVAAGASGASAQGLSRRVNIALTGNAAYDTNVAHTGRALAASRGLTRSDVRFTPGASIDVSLPLGLQNVSLGGTIGYDFYSKNTRLNRERILLDAAAGLRLGRCSGGLSASYVRRQSDPGDLVIVLPDGSIDQRVKNAEEIKTIGANASCGAAVGLRPTASVQQSWVDNSSRVRQFGTYRTSTISAGLGYARPSLGTVTLFGRYSTTSYPDRPDLLGTNESDGFKSRAAGISFGRDIGSRLTGTAEVSFTSVRPDRQGVREFDGVNWSAALTARVNDRLTASTNVSRGINAPNRIDANYSIQTLYGLDISYSLTPRLSASLGANYTKRDFRGAGLGVGAGIGSVLVEDERKSVHAGLRYAGTRRISFNAGASYENRNANGDLLDYSGATFSVGAAISL